MDLLRFASCLCSLLLLPASQTLRIFARLASHALVATSQSQNPHRLLAQHSSPRIPTPLTRPAVVPCPPVTKIITVITRNYTSLSPPHVMKAAFPSLAGSAFAWLPPYIQIASGVASAPARRYLEYTADVTSRMDPLDRGCFPRLSCLRRPWQIRLIRGMYVAILAGHVVGGVAEASNVVQPPGACCMS